MSFRGVTNLRFGKPIYHGVGAENEQKMKKEIHPKVEET